MVGLLRGIQLGILFALCFATTVLADVPKDPKAKSEYTSLVAQADEAAASFNCEKAEELYQKALAINDKGLEAIVGSANCNTKQSKWSNAQTRFERALAINPKYEPALWGRAEAFRLALQNEQAIAAYRKYLAVFPNVAKAKQALDKLGGPATPLVADKPLDPNRKVPRFPKRPQDVAISITGTRIVANGVELSGTPKLADFEAIYGKPDRVWDTKNSINRIHTWDRLGFVAYEPHDGRVTSATFPFKSLAMDYDPKTMFGGTIVVDGYSLTATTQLVDVKARPGATQPYSATSTMIAKGDFNVFVTGRNGPLDLVELGLWKKTAAPIAKPGKYAAKDVRIVINGRTVTMNGVAISGKPYLKDIEAIYGKPDRVYNSGGATSNRIHTWDKLGIIAYAPPDGRCVSTTFPYRSVSSNFDPTTWFGGSITVDGRAMPSTIDIATLKQRPGAGQPYGADSIVFDKGDFHVFTISKTGAGIDLVEISYWQQDKQGATGNIAEGTHTPTTLTAKDIRVEVTSSGGVKLQTTDIGGRPMLADLEKLYGKPSRVWDKKGAANRIHTWDALGIVAYEPFNGRVASLTLPFRPMKNGDKISESNPSTGFKGRVSLDGRGFYNFNTIGTIKTRAGATQPYGEESVVFDFGDVHVFIKGPAARDPIELVEVSFWHKK